MKYEDALKKIEGAQSAGGDLIVVRDGVHIVVGKHVQGNLVVADTDEARMVMMEVETQTAVKEKDDEPKPEPKQGVAVGEPAPGTEPAGTTHNVEHEDQVGLQETHGRERSKK